MTRPDLSRLVIPDEWRGVIDRVNSVFPGAVLSGGALRDLVWDKKSQVKDLDFAIPKSALTALGGPSDFPDWELEAVFNGHYFGFRQEVLAVERYVLGGGMPNVELIYLDRPAEGLMDYVVHRNDFGCCQVAYSKDAFVYSDDFLFDELQNRFTLVNCEDVTQADRSLRRAERWREKYPDIVMDLTKAHAILKDFSE